MSFYVLLWRKAISQPIWRCSTIYTGIYNFYKLYIVHLYNGLYSSMLWKKEAKRLTFEVPIRNSLLGSPKTDLRKKKISVPLFQVPLNPKIHRVPQDLHSDIKYYIQALHDLHLEMFRVYFGTIQAIRKNPRGKILRLCFLSRFILGTFPNVDWAVETDRTASSSRLLIFLHQVLTRSFGILFKAYFPCYCISSCLQYCFCNWLTLSATYFLHLV